MHGRFYIYTVEQYPTHIRATGISWAVSCMGFGLILGPIIVIWLSYGQNWVIALISFVLLNIVGGLLSYVGKEMRLMKCPN